MNKQKIKVLGNNYDLIYFKGDINEDGRIGESGHVDLEIKVFADMPKDIQRETVIHELLHCIDVTTCSGLIEEQVIRLSNVMYCVLKDNKEYFMNMLEEIKKEEEEE